MAVEYVCDIPLSIRLDLCDLLDINDSWVELASNIGFTAQQVALLKQRCRNSPTDAVLNKWAQDNAKTVDLLAHLQTMTGVAAMRLIRDCVPSDAYHQAMKALDVPMDER